MLSSVRLKSLILLLLSLRRHLLTTLKSPLHLPGDRLNGLNVSSSQLFINLPFFLLLLPLQSALSLLSSWTQHGVCMSYAVVREPLDALAEPLRIPSLALNCCMSWDQAEPLVLLQRPQDNGMGSTEISLLCPIGFMCH